MSNSPAPTAPAAVDPSAALFLGAGVALAASATSSALLFPEVERGLDHARAISGWLACLAVGAWLTRWFKSSPRHAWIAAALSVAGAVLTRAWLPSTHVALIDDLVTQDRAVPALSVSWRAVMLAAPVALPLGWLCARTLTLSGKRGLVAWWLGLALGVSLTPWMQQWLFGAPSTLLIGACSALPAAWLLSERPAGGPAGPRLSKAACVELLLLGAAGMLLVRRLGVHVDLADLGLPVWIAAALFGAALGQALPLRVLPREVLLPVALLLPCLFADAELLRRVPPDGFAADVLRAVLMGLPLGLAVGRCARPVGSGLPWLTAPLLLFAPGALMVHFVFPRLSLVSVSLGLGLVALGVLILRRPKPRPAWLAIGLGLALSAYLLDVRPPGGSVAAAGPAVQQLAGDIHYSATPAAIQAFDGQLERSWSAARARRLVHLPALFQGQPQRTLLASADRGAAVAALSEHGVQQIDWCRPQHTEVSGTLPQGVKIFLRGERLTLAQAAAPYAMIVMLPDPRVRQRLSRLSTVEFYESTASRLTAAGLLCQWWDLASVHVEDLRAALASAQVAFEHVSLITENPRARRGLVAIVAGAAPLVLHPHELKAQLAARPKVRADFVLIGLDADMLPTLLQHDTQQLRLLAPPSLAVHDARPMLGVRAGLRSLSATERLLSGLRFVSSARVDGMRWVVAPEGTSERLAADLRRTRRAWALLQTSAIVNLRVRGAAALDVDEEPPGHGLFEELEALAQTLAELPEWRFATEQIVACAQAWRSDGRHDLAESLLRRARAATPRPPLDVLKALAMLLEDRQNLSEAAEVWGAVLERSPFDQLAHDSLERIQRG